MSKSEVRVDVLAIIGGVDVSGKLCVGGIFGSAYTNNGEPFMMGCYTSIGNLVGKSENIEIR